MLIGLNGRLKAGKDTTFGIIQKLHPEAERVSFADKLYESAAAALGIGVEALRELKNDEEDAAIMLFGSGGNAFHSLSFREYLQRYGTEAHRDVFGQEFWVDMALPANLNHSDKLLVVTDMRFPNEAARVGDLGGHLVKVCRHTETRHSEHASEQNIDYMIDYFLDNTGTLEDLEGNVVDMMFRLTESEVPELFTAAAISEIEGDPDAYSG